MRQRKFRGKTTQESKFFSKNEWVFGTGVKYDSITEETYISTTIKNDLNEFDLDIQVDPETVGDFVFLDIRGNEVYEEDILQSDRYYFDEAYYGIVYYDEESCMYYVEAQPRASSKVKGISEGISNNIEEYKWEKVGNVFDNPALIR